MKKLYIDKSGLYLMTTFLKLIFIQFRMLTYLQLTVMVALLAQLVRRLTFKVMHKFGKCGEYEFPRSRMGYCFIV